LLAGRRQFCDAFYELIDNWCDGIGLGHYAKFITTVYEHIRLFWRKDEGGTFQYIIADRNSIGSIEQALAVIRAEGEAQYKKDLVEDKREMRRLQAFHQHLIKQREEQDALNPAAASQRKEKKSRFTMMASDALDAKPAASRKIQALAANQLEYLKQILHYLAHFGQAEEEYFLEMLVERAVRNTWSVGQEIQFRNQMLARPDQSSGHTQLMTLLDQLQQGYLAGMPPTVNEESLAKVRTHCTTTLHVQLDSSAVQLTKTRWCRSETPPRRSCNSLNFHVGWQ
jgi:hypothetical protein